MVADTGQQELKRAINSMPLPQHVAIIMDGNGRWARRRGFPRTAGHRQGLKTVRRIVDAAGELGLPVLTLFAFSTENWQRPEQEVSFLMDLLITHIRSDLETLHENGVRLRILGDPQRLPRRVRREVVRALDITAHNEDMVLALALNYGGRQEIIQAARRLARAAQQGDIAPEDIGEDEIARRLDTRGLPDPDLLIRPSGEQRISNFLLWQIAYTELWLTDVCWPDFTPAHLFQAIYDYQHRERRFGGLASE